MIYTIDKSILMNTFQVDSISNLELTLSKFSPSTLEYYLSILEELAEKSIHFNKSSIQYSIYIFDYIIYQDYEDKYFFEIQNRHDSDYAASLF